jgi:hypothetical protein
MTSRSLRRKWEEWLANEKLNITHIDQIVPWFLANQNTIITAVQTIENSTPLWPWDGSFHDTDEYTELSLDVNYKPLCSNSHSAPVGKPENWNRFKDVPLGYPGWHGRLKGSLKRLSAHNYSYPYNSCYKFIGLNTGSGGGGNESHSYDVTIFLDDWPGLGSQFQVEEAIREKAAEDARLEAIRQAELKKIRDYEWEQNKIIARLNGTYRY